MMSWRKRKNGSQKERDELNSRHRRHDRKQIGEPIETELEALEKRQMMAGDVVASLNGSNLKLTGDASDNHVEISQSGNELTIQGNDTTIVFNGNSAASHTIMLDESGLKNLRVIMQDGADIVDVSEVTVGNNFTMDTGDGFDQVLINGLSVGRNLVIQTGNESDFVVIDDATVDGKATVALGASTGFETRFGGPGDSLQILNSELLGQVRVTQTAEQSSVQIENSTFANKLSIDVDSGFDEVQLAQSQVSGDLSIDLGDSKYSADSASLSYVMVDGSVSISQGDGSAEVDFLYANVAEDLSVRTGDDSDTVSVFGDRDRSSVGIEPLRVGGSADIDLGSANDGTDRLTLTGTTVTGNLSVKQTNGTAELSLAYDGYGFDLVQIGGDLSISTGNENDQIRTGGGGNLTVSGNASIDLGASTDLSDFSRGGGADSLILGSASVQGDLEISQTTDRSLVALDQVFVTGDLSVSLSSGDDQIIVGGYGGMLRGGSSLSVSGNAEFDLGSSFESYDVMSIASATISGDLVIIQRSNAAIVNFDSKYGGQVQVNSDLEISTGTGNDYIFSDIFGSDSDAASAGGTMLTVSGNADVNLGSSERTATDFGEAAAGLAARGIGGDVFEFERFHVEGDLNVKQAGNSGYVGLTQASVNGLTEIATGNGDDVVDVTSLIVPGRGLPALTMQVNTGGGSDELTVTNVNLGDSEFKLGGGDDIVTLESANVLGAFVLDMGGGDDTGQIANSQFMASLEFNGRGGLDALTFDDVTSLDDDPVFKSIEDFVGDF